MMVFIPSGKVGRTGIFFVTPPLGLLLILTGLKAFIIIYFTNTVTPGGGTPLGGIPRVGLVTLELGLLGFFVETQDLGFLLGGGFTKNGLNVVVTIGGLNLGLKKCLPYPTGFTDEVILNFVVVTGNVSYFLILGLTGGEPPSVDEQLTPWLSLKHGVFLRIPGFLRVLFFTVVDD